MTKRKIDKSEESLRDFSKLIKKRINDDIKFWKTQDPNHAKGREMAFSACLSELKEALEKNGLTLSDIGLADYKIPEAKELDQ